MSRTSAAVTRIDARLCLFALVIAGYRGGELPSTKPVVVANFHPHNLRTAFRCR